MNIFYYLVGAFITFIGVITFRIIEGSGIYELNPNNLIENGIISLIAGISFFMADYFMKKN